MNKSNFELELLIIQLEARINMLEYEIRELKKVKHNKRSADKAKNKSNNLI